MEMCIIYEAGKGENTEQDLSMGSRVFLHMLRITDMCNSHVKMSSDLLYVKSIIQKGGQRRCHRNRKNYLESSSLEELQL